MYNQPFSEGLHIKFKKLTVDQFLNFSLIQAEGESFFPSRLFPAGEKH